MSAANNRRYFQEENDGIQEQHFKENMTVECICPKCGIQHKMKLLWSGRGQPKKFCQPCKTFVTTIESIDFCGVSSDIKKGIEKSA
jgi:hypothetical protein